MKHSALLSVCAAALCTAFLAGCGNAASTPASSGAAPASSAAGAVSSSAVSSQMGGVEDITAAGESILAANPISNLFTFTETNIKLDLGLSADSYTACYAVKSNDQGDAGTVIVIVAADGQTSAVSDAVEAYRQTQISQCANYPEFADAQAKFEAATVESNDGGIVILAVPSNECTDEAALQAAVDAVIG